jgi:hypothetical protein
MASVTTLTPVDSASVADLHLQHTSPPPYLSTKVFTTKEIGLDFSVDPGQTGKPGMSRASLFL